LLFWILCLIANKASCIYIIDQPAVKKNGYTFFFFFFFLKSNRKFIPNGYTLLVSPISNNRLTGTIDPIFTIILLVYSEHTIVITGNISYVTRVKYKKTQKREIFFFLFNNRYYSKFMNSNV